MLRFSHENSEHRTAQSFQSSLQGLWLLLAIAILIIYIALGILYESFIHPLTILCGKDPIRVAASSQSYLPDKIRKRSR